MRDICIQVIYSQIMGKKSIYLFKIAAFYEISIVIRVELARRHNTRHM